MNMESFVRLGDKKLDPCPTELLTPLLDIINQCTKRISKRRFPSSQVTNIESILYYIHAYFGYNNMQVLDILEGIQL